MACERVVALIDMDCFYVQVEQRLNPALRGKPCAVVQYNHWKGGGIIAVAYEARKFGVTRNMRGDDAKKKCPDIILARVPEARGKANLTRYRDAGAEVIQILQTFCDVCERASVDEAYLDLSEKVDRSLENMSLEELAEQTLQCSHIVGFTNHSDSSANHHDQKGLWLAALSDQRNRRLAMGALIVQQAREAVKEKAGFTCSAGIAHNKVMAKLAGGTHKPNQQTILPHESVLSFFKTIPIGKVRFFGGKFGQNVMDVLQVGKMSELTKFSLEYLRNCFGEKSGSWLYHMCRGTEHEPVRARQLTKSTGCGKNFTGPMKLVSKEKVCHWMLKLTEELHDRLQGEETRNQRVAKLVSVGLILEDHTSVTRSFPLKSSDPQWLCDNAMQVIKSFNTGKDDQWHPAVVSLNINASKFEEITKSSIASFFSKSERSSELSEEGSHDQRNEKVRELAQLGEEGSSTESNGIQSNLLIPSTPSKAEPWNYDLSEIDTSIVDELPEDLRNEVISFLRIQKPPSETKKRCLNGIQKYTMVKAGNTDSVNLLNPIASPENSTRMDVTEACLVRKDESSEDSTRVNDKVCLASEDSDSKKLSENDLGRNFEEVKQCPKCSERLAPCKMTEHLDFHFATELQNNSDEVDNSNTREVSPPPKKRPKRTIDHFFVAKGR